MSALTVADVVGDYTGLARKVLEYSRVMKELVDAAKRPGFTADGWGPLAACVDTASFSRIGPFKDSMDWPGYVQFLTGWASASEWEGRFKRVTELGPLVLLELEEYSKVGDHESLVNTATTFEFNETGLLEKLAVYIQMEFR